MVYLPINNRVENTLYILNAIGKIFSFKLLLVPERAGFFD